MLTPLNRNTVPVEQRPIKVIQFGEGNFLRAFADWIIDILNEETQFNGDVLVVQPLAKGLGEMLNQQEGLYHVFLHGIQSGKQVRTARLVKSVREVLNPYDDFMGFLKSSEQKDLRFVISNTTEAGIIFSSNDTDPSVLASTFPGKVTQWLHHRYTWCDGAKDKGVIFLPCELIDKNGEALKTAILQYADLWKFSGGFKSWIEDNNTFCNTLVDRIVPGYPKDNAQELQQEIGFNDQLMVKAEPFHLWVVEGPQWILKEFPVNKTNLDVKFTDNLAAYRTRKVRILNGAHTSIVPIAYLKGLRTVQETVEDQAVSAQLKRIIFEEIIPTLDLPKEELESFAHSVLERFRNPFIRHELLSIALNSISKFKVRVLPSLLEYYQRQGKLPVGLVTSLAALIRFYRGDYSGERIALNDSPEVLEFFKKIQGLPVADAVSQTLANINFWGEDLSKIEGLEQLVTSTIRETANAEVS